MHFTSCATKIIITSQKEMSTKIFTGAQIFLSPANIQF